MFFNRPDFDLAIAAPGTYALQPHHEMVELLRSDYRAMTGMIFGDPPTFDDVLASVATVEQQPNGAMKAR